MQRPTEDDLLQMSYSELRKCARQSGIKGKRKAADLISCILGKDSDDDSFVTLERKIINSCSKLKEEKFNKDKLTASATPRRETYTVDSPLDDMVWQKDLVISSASPILRKSPNMSDSLNVTITRGSEKKLNRKISFVTPIRRSARLNALTPSFASVKDRPKTPIPSRSSSGKNNSNVKKSSTHLLTPNNSSQGRSKVPGGSGIKRTTTPYPVLASKQKTATPLSNAKRAAISVSVSKMKGSTPSTSDIKMNASPFVSGSQGKGISTPNFNKLHQKAFDKMESIDEYKNRREVASLKKLKDQKCLQDRIKAKRAAKTSKIPKKFGGIPFIPSVTNIANIKTNFALSAQGTKSSDKNAVLSVSRNESTMSAGKKILKSVSCENTPMRKKAKFDIQASLSKKLPYKPHSGPLKPLSAKNLSSILSTRTQQKRIENPMIQAKRIQSRTLLKGVRTNRRFELQMKNRKPT